MEANFVSGNILVANVLNHAIHRSMLIRLLSLRPSPMTHGDKKIREPRHVVQSGTNISIHFNKKRKVYSRNEKM